MGHLGEFQAWAKKSRHMSEKSSRESVRRRLGLADGVIMCIMEDDVAMEEDVATADTDGETMQSMGLGITTCTNIAA